MENAGGGKASLEDLEVELKKFLTVLETVVIEAEQPGGNANGPALTPEVAEQKGRELRASHERMNGLIKNLAVLSRSEAALEEEIKHLQEENNASIPHYEGAKRHAERILAEIEQGMADLVNPARGEENGRMIDEESKN